MDLNQDGQIHFSEFVPWYTRSEERMRNKTRAVFEMFDKVRCFPTTAPFFYFVYPFESSDQLTSLCLCRCCHLPIPLARRTRTARLTSMRSGIAH